MTTLLYRADASATQGFGHLRRALSLAKAARSQGLGARFLVRDGPAARTAVGNAEFPVATLREGATLREEVSGIVGLARETGCDGVVLDVPSVLPPTLAEISSAGLFIVLIEDAPNVEYPCHLVVSGGVQASAWPCPKGTQAEFLRGPEFCILDPEYESVPDRVLSPRVSQVLLTVGAGDPHRLLPRLLRAIDSLRSVFVITVIEGFLCPRGSLEPFVEGAHHEVRIVAGPRTLYSYLLAADVAVSAAGQTACELAATGTPTIAFRGAADQAHQLEALTGRGAVLNAGDALSEDVSGRVARWLALLLDSPELRVELSRASRALIDGGGARRVAGRLALRLEQRRSAGQPRSACIR